MKEEITIPPQYAQIIKAEAERRNISIEDVVHIALKKYLERSKTDAK
ncbi:MAG: hypothetical protein IJH80_02115 [Ruminococcus sp.]|nr:hypothetical protein [Ruminococcus sp.]